MDKSSIRQNIRAKRKSLSADLIHGYSKAIIKHILETDLLQSSAKVACYLAFDAEVDTIELIHYLQDKKIKCYVPVIVNAQTAEMNFYPYFTHSAKIRNRYGILEPDTHQLAPIDIHELDLIFVPLIAFDRKGNRLGMGKGYYDRFLRSLKTHHRPKIIGLAYHFQEVKRVPTDPWDIKLHQIITDKQSLIFD